MVHYDYLKNSVQIKLAVRKWYTWNSFQWVSNTVCRCRTSHYRWFIWL